MRPDNIGLLVGLGLGFGLAELLDQTHGLALEATVEPTARTGVHDIAKLFGRKVEKSASVELETRGRRRLFFFGQDALVKLNAAVRKLAESSLSLKL